MSRSRFVSTHCQNFSCLNASNCFNFVAFSSGSLSKNVLSFLINFKNYNEYFKDYISYSDFEVNKETIMSWKTNQYTVKERLFLKQFIVKRQKGNELIQNLHCRHYPINASSNGVGSDEVP